MLLARSTVEPTVHKLLHILLRIQTLFPIPLVVVHFILCMVTATLIIHDNITLLAINYYA
jgi:hypothetical protein